MRVRRESAGGAEPPAHRAASGRAAKRVKASRARPAAEERASEPAEVENVAAAAASGLGEEPSRDEARGRKRKALSSGRRGGSVAAAPGALASGSSPAAGGSAGDASPSGSRSPSPSSAGGSFVSMLVRVGRWSGVVRSMWLRPYEGHPEFDPSLTLYVTGIPAGVSAPSLVAAFSRFGEVRRLALARGGGSCAVAFAEEGCVSAALRRARKGHVVSLEAEGDPSAQAPGTDRVRALGLKSWVEEFKAGYPGNAALAKELDAWTEEHERRLAEARAEHLASLREEGWTVVRTRSEKKRVAADQDGGAKGMAEGLSAEAAARALERAKERELELQKTDFYRTQAKESRRNELLELRKKFDEDKKRIAEIRAARKFEPL